jgi:asparagine synthase (glutamine-hydrolysing)
MTSGLKVFFSDPVKAAILSYDAFVEMKNGLPTAYPEWDGFSQAQYLEAMYLLPGYILSSQGDRVAMAHSVEGRYPFLDHRVVEFAATIPAHLKMKVLNEKYILKRCAGHLIPPSITQRPKQPYRAPEGKSFLGGGPHKSTCHPYVEELLSPDRIQGDGIFNPAAVQKLVEKAQKGQAIGIKDNMALVGILSTQLVIDQFINHFKERTPDVATH